MAGFLNYRFLQFLQIHHGKKWFLFCKMFVSSLDRFIPSSSNGFVSLSAFVGDLSFQVFLQ
jgi:hypothetical protein